jgi:serine/threonine protein kinase
MLEPMVGARQWLHFANRLVSGLSHLHKHGVIHGDIKPANVLLKMASSRAPAPGGAHPDQPSMEDADPFDGNILFDPVYCDFSSARVEQAGVVPEEISAVTTSYTAPELLEALHQRKEHRAVATVAADIFALGCTLLVPATGDELYHNINNNLHRITLARHGKPLDYARNGEQASRVMKGKLVDTVLLGAVEKEAAGRWSTADWRAVIDTVAMESLAK